MGTKMKPDDSIVFFAELMEGVQITVWKSGLKGLKSACKATIRRLFIIWLLMNM